MDLPGNSFFIGRETFLQTLHTTLQRERRAVIAGMSGVGKTAAAREYAQRFGQYYQSVFWMNAATDETLLADLFAVMQLLSLPTDMKQGSSTLLQALQSYLLARQDSLLILDNLPSSFIVQDSPEQTPLACPLLLITRSSSTPPEIPRLELASLDAQEGALLLLRQIGWLAAHAILDQAEEEQRIAALELARELHGFPIALNLTAGYLRETGGSIQDYLFSFRDCPEHLHLPVSPDGSDMQTVAVACELSLTHLEQEHPAALASLHIGALLLPEALPATLFQEEAELPLQTSAEKPGPHKETLPVLLASGLLTIEKEASTLNMHPLVQNLVAQFFALDKPQPQVEQALRLFQRSLPSFAKEPLAARLRIVRHIEHLATLSKQWPLFFDEAGEVFNWAASLLWEVKLIDKAEAFLRRALVIWERTRGLSDPLVATVLGNLATLNGLLKNYAEAEALSHRAIESKTRALGINHPDVILALEHLGRIYAEQGKQQEARQCYEKAIVIGDRVKLRLHPVYSAVRYDLALLYIEQEQFDKAESLLRRVCVVLDKVSGPRDQLTMAARFSLAEVFARLKNWERAETCYRETLPVCAQLLGEEHPVTLGHVERAALVFLQRGNTAEAKLNLQRVLAVRERTNDVQQADIATCLNGLARVALAQEQIPEALALLERAQRIYAGLPDSENLAIAALLDTLASVEVAQQQYEQAISTYKQALDRRVQIPGREHTSLVENLSNLATLYLIQEQFHQAEPLLLQALSLYEDAQKPDDLILDPVLNSLAEIEMRREHLWLTKKYLQRSHAIREQALGQADPRTEDVVQKLAHVSVVLKAQVSA